MPSEFAFIDSLRARVRGNDGVVRGIGGYLPNYHSDLPPHERKPPLETVQSTQPEADGRKLLAAFLPKAFRRKIAPEEIEPYVALLKSRLAAKDCFGNGILTQANGSAVIKDDRLHFRHNISAAQN